MPRTRHIIGISRQVYHSNTGEQPEASHLELLGFYNMPM